jgi:hypothetical protein
MLHMWQMYSVWLWTLLTYRAYWSVSKKFLWKILYPYSVVANERSPKQCLDLYWLEHPSVNSCITSTSYDIESKYCLIWQADIAVLRGNTIIQNAKNLFSFCNNDLKEPRSAFFKRRIFRYVESVDRDNIRNFKQISNDIESKYCLICCWAHFVKLWSCCKSGDMTKKCSVIISGKSSVLFKPSYSKIAYLYIIVTCKLHSVRWK